MVVYNNNVSNTIILKTMQIAIGNVFQKENTFYAVVTNVCLLYMDFTIR